MNGKLTFITTRVSLYLILLQHITTYHKNS